MKRILLILLLQIMVQGLWAQSSNIDLEQLKQPSSPAASIMSIQPTEVNSPKSFKALEAAALTNYLDSTNNLSLPEDYAIEITPYLLSKRKNFDYKEYLSEDWGKNFMRNISLSVASTKSFLIADSLKTNAIGLGFRTMLLNGKVNQDLKQKFVEHYEKHRLLNDIPALVNGIIRKFIRVELPKNESANKVDVLNYILPKIKLSDSESLNHQAKNIIIKTFEQLQDNIAIDRIAEEFENHFDLTYLNASLEEFRSLIDQTNTERYGLRMELDFAMGINFPTNNFDYSFVPRWGTWINTSYRNKKLGSIEGILLTRYINQDYDYFQKYAPADTTFTGADNFDIGGRLVFRGKSFTIEAEAIYRNEWVTLSKTEVSETRTIKETDKRTSWKYMVNFNYKVSSNLVLSYNLGKHFDPLVQGQGNLISTLSLNLGFGGPTVQNLLKN